MFKNVKDIGNLCRISTSHYFLRRSKHGPDHWSQIRKRKTATMRALEHFDDFYKNVFDKRWPTMRSGLLGKSKYVAVVNNFGDTERIVSFLENLGAMNVKRLFEVWEEKLDSSGKRRTKLKPDSKKLESLMEKLSEEKLEEELGSIYPADSKVLDNTRTSHVHEHKRLIEPLDGFSSGTLQEFIPATELKGMDDWVPESEHYDFYKSGDDIPILLVEQEKLDFPSHLKVFSFEDDNTSDFPPVRKSLTGVSDYYLMDGGSLLPVLALGLRPGDFVLDMCSAPGGKSLICMQTLYPSNIHLNDSSLSRINRTKRVMQEFLYNFEDKLSNGELILTQKDGRSIDLYNTFDKIMVDVPCTNDRHSLHEEDNNMFKSTRAKERIRIPEIQSDLLTHALKLVKKGGTVVYSTCSLSPIQNDGVVGMALRKIHENTNHRIAVVDMTVALEQTQVIYKYVQGVLRYGHLVRPHLSANFGPMYFCKMVKLC